MKNLPIVGNLDDVVDWYFEIRPPFSEGKPKEFPDALIISALDQYHKQHHANIAVISADGDFSKACAMKNYFLHFANLEQIYRSIPAGAVRRGKVTRRHRPYKAHRDRRSDRTKSNSRSRQQSDNN